ncbi:MAG: hypothetical protein K2Y23_01260 [Cyanobacteria bacterium]|nr:hypothetical protein [Cyanobacteriota bacterium]
MFPPWLVAIPGLLLIVAGHAKDRYGVMCVGLLWFFYGMYEHNVQATCTGECNIRFDLVLIYPVLGLATLGSIVSLMLSDKSKRRSR